MVWLNTALYFLSEYAIYITAVMFLHCFYDSQFVLHKTKAVLFLALSVVSALYNASIIEGIVVEILYVLCEIAGCVAAVYNHKAKRVKAAFCFLGIRFTIMFLVVAIVEFATICFSSGFYIRLFASVNFTLQDEILANSLMLTYLAIMCISLMPAYKKGITMRCGKREFWLIFSVMLISWVMIFILFAFREVIQVILVLLGMLMMAASFASMFLIYSSRVRGYYRDLSAAQEKQMETELMHFRQYRQSQEEVSRFRHDIKNNLICVNDMMQKGKTAEATDYLKNIVDVVEGLAPQYVTGDELLDGIVGVKVQIMEQQDISFTLDGVLAGGLSWKPMDICNVFANALDNAIEACELVPFEKRYIAMKIKSTPQFWFITIENSVAKKVDISKIFQKNGGYTTKSDAAHHGIGTYNMKHTVESYGDMLKAECTDDTFRLEIMIDKSSSK